MEICVISIYPTSFQITPQYLEEMTLVGTEKPFFFFGTDLVGIQLQSHILT